MFGMAVPEEVRREYERQQILEATPKRSQLPARLIHLREIYERSLLADFEVGDVVTPTKDSSANKAYIGQPHVVLVVLEDRLDPRLERPLANHQIATLDVDGDVTVTMIERWRIEKWSEDLLPAEGA